MKLARSCGEAFDGNVSSVLAFLDGNSFWDPHTPQGNAFVEVSRRLTREFLSRMVQLDGHDLCSFVRRSVVCSRVRSVFYFSGPFQHHLRLTNQNVSIPSWTLMNVALSQEVVHGVRVHDVVSETVHDRILTSSYRMTWLDVFEACQVLSFLFMTRSPANTSDDLLMDPKMLKSLFCRSDQHNMNAMIEVSLRVVSSVLDSEEPDSDGISRVLWSEETQILDTVSPLADVAMEQAELACLSQLEIPVNATVLLRSLARHERFTSSLTRHVERVLEVLPMSRRHDERASTDSSAGVDDDKETNLPWRRNVTYTLAVIRELVSGTSVETLTMMVRKNVFEDVVRACLYEPHLSVDTLRRLHDQWPGETLRVVRKHLGEDMPTELFRTRTEAVTTHECPVSMQPCVYPVVLSDGHTYERDSALRLLTKTRVSPMTRETLSYRVFTNRGLMS